MDIQIDYLVLKWLHVLSSTVLFGTGLGTAFYMWVTNRSGNLQAMAVVSTWVVRADWMFTTPTVIAQPLTGLWLMYLAGFSINQPWLLASLILYLVAGACWLPVVWLQLRMRDMVRMAVQEGSPLPQRFWKYERIWTLLGVPAFLSLVVVFYLMVAKPVV